MSSFPCRHAACSATRPKCCAGAAVGAAPTAVPRPLATHVLLVHILTLAQRLSHRIVLVRRTRRMEAQGSLQAGALTRFALRRQLLLSTRFRLDLADQGLDIKRFPASGCGRGAFSGEFCHHPSMRSGGVELQPYHQGRFG